uniref:Ribbon-helix-helix protein, CopG family n=1 Tax=Thermus tengchongensis TaxID=1214928 RepID=A0A7V4A2H9_9DEIN
MPGVLVHLRLPEELVKRLDEERKGRSRSEVVAEALEDYLKRVRLLSLVEEVAGSVGFEEAPHWATPEDVVGYVRTLRGEAEAHLDALSPGQHGDH